MTYVLLAGGVAFFVALVVAAAVAVWGSNWGATEADRVRRLPGDAFLADCSTATVVMTRAITIDATPATVWPWLAQIGRGAGWYSYDRLDNGGRRSAEHIVSWVPEPQLGDATPIGYLRHLEEQRSLVWWVRDIRFAGTTACAVFDMSVRPEGEGSRVVVRVSAGADGLFARPALLLLRVIDSIMARRQLLGLRGRVERFGDRRSDPAQPETGARDQFQLYEAVLASGESVGVRGKEHAQWSRELAIEDGVIEPDGR